MEIQTFTFDLQGMTDRQAYHYVESFRLGLSEFEGLVRHGRSRRSVSGEWVVFCTWRDEQSVQEFRRSDTYARFALSRNVVGLREHVESVHFQAVDEELCAAA